MKVFTFLNIFGFTLLLQACGQNSDTYSKLMILDSGRVQVIDLSGGGQTCPEFSNGPVNGDAVGVFIDGKAMACAGVDSPNECFVFDEQTLTWSVGPSLNYYNPNRASALLNENEWWISGGQSFTQGVSSTELFSIDTNSFATYTELPRPEYSHVMIPYDKDKVIFLGGIRGSEEVYVYDKALDRWNQLTTLPGFRIPLAAGLVTHSDGRRELVVTGGRYDPSTDIFDLETNVWRPGAHSLPVSSLEDAASVQFQNTFLVMGGYDFLENKFIDSIFEFNPETEEWIEREEKLNHGSDKLTAFLIPDDYIPCN